MKKLLAVCLILCLLLTTGCSVEIAPPAEPEQVHQEVTPPAEELLPEVLEEPGTVVLDVDLHGANPPTEESPVEEEPPVEDFFEEGPRILVFQKSAKEEEPKKEPPKPVQTPVVQQPAAPQKPAEPEPVVPEEPVITEPIQGDPLGDDDAFYDEDDPLTGSGSREDDPLQGGYNDDYDSDRNNNKNESNLGKDEDDDEDEDDNSSNNNNNNNNEYDPNEDATAWG